MLRIIIALFVSALFSSNIYALDNDDSDTPTLKNSQKTIPHHAIKPKKTSATKPLHNLTNKKVNSVHAKKSLNTDKAMPSHLAELSKHSVSSHSSMSKPASMKLASLTKTDILSDIKRQAAVAEKAANVAINNKVHAKQYSSLISHRLDKTKQAVVAKQPVVAISKQSVITKQPIVAMNSVAKNSAISKQPVITKQPIVAISSTTFKQPFASEQSIPSKQPITAKISLPTEIATTIKMNHSSIATKPQLAEIKPAPVKLADSTRTNDVAEMKRLANAAEIAASLAIENKMGLKQSLHVPSTSKVVSYEQTKDSQHTNTAAKYSTVDAPKTSITARHVTTVTSQASSIAKHVITTSSQKSAVAPRPVATSNLAVASNSTTSTSQPIKSQPPLIFADTTQIANAQMMSQLQQSLIPQNMSTIGLPTAKPAPISKPVPLNVSKIENITGIKGELNKQDQTYKISVPRDDLKTTVNGTVITPEMGLTSSITLKSIDKNALLVGELALAPDQVNPLIAVALQNGLQVTALHNSFMWANPQIIFMRIEGTGTQENLAKGLNKIFAEIKTTSNGRGDLPFANVDPEDTTLNPQKLDTMLGLKGSLKNGVYKVALRQSPSIENDKMNELGASTWATFIGSNSEAVVNGNFILQQAELQKVLAALYNSNIYIIGIDQQTANSQPYVSIHFLGIGSTKELAKGVRNALNLSKHIATPDENAG